MSCPCVYKARIAGGEGSRTVLDLENLKDSGWLIEKKGKSYNFHSPAPERKFFKSSKDVTLFLKGRGQYEATVRCSCGQSNTSTPSAVDETGGIPSSESDEEYRPDTEEELTSSAYEETPVKGENNARPHGPFQAKR